VEAKDQSNHQKTMPVPEPEEKGRIPWQVGLGIIATGITIVWGVAIFSAVYSKVVGFGEGAALQCTALVRGLQCKLMDSSEASTCPPAPPIYANGAMLVKRNHTLAYNHKVHYR
jgi:hypothetical protein